MFLQNISLFGLHGKLRCALAKNYAILYLIISSKNFLWKRFNIMGYNREINIRQFFPEIFFWCRWAVQGFSKVH